MEMSSKLMRLTPPSVLRTSKRTVPLTFTVKLAVASVWPLVVTGEPTCVQLPPPLLERYSAQVPLASVP